MAAVHHTELGLRALTNPARFKNNRIPRLAAPVRYDDRVYYSDPARRGYLVEDVWAKCADADKSFMDRYVKVDPIEMPPAPVQLRDYLNSQ